MNWFETGTFGYDRKLKISNSFYQRLRFSRGTLSTVKSAFKATRSEHRYFRL